MDTETLNFSFKNWDFPKAIHYQEALDKSIEAINSAKKGNILVACTSKLYENRY